MLELRSSILTAKCPVRYVGQKNCNNRLKIKQRKQIPPLKYLTLQVSDSMFYIWRKEQEGKLV